MDSPPPDFRLADALTPFSDVEVNRLRRYIDRAEKLKGVRFFAEKDQKFSITATPEGVSFSSPLADDDEAVTAMAACLRNLHSKGRSSSASFPRMVAVLRSHAEGAEEREANEHSRWFLRVLDHREDRVKEIMNSSLIGMASEREDSEGNVISEEVPPHLAFEDWLYGRYLHDDEERIARIEEWGPYTPLHQFTFLEMAVDLTKVYYGFTGIVREVMGEPSLMPASSSAA